MSFIPQSPAEQKKMLDEMGQENLAGLFRSIPGGCRLRGPLALPDGLSELEILRRFSAWASENASPVSFLGAGAYGHFIPAVVDHLVSRSEFFTAYTPYQPEISQGTLQAIFEYQTMIADLTGEDVSNASLYDGATALAESVLLSFRTSKRRRLVISEAVHPTYRKVLSTYVGCLDLEVVTVPVDASGRTDREAARQALSTDAFALAVQSPNFFGVIEDLEALGAARPDGETHFIVTVTEAVSLGLLEPPGSFGADIVTGEAQSLGVPLNFGGPYLGFMACRDRFKRQMPGRIVGQTTDTDGKRAFVLTLATREQHIRREKATSNICTNSGLNALACAVTLSALGPGGLAAMARLNYEKAEYAKGLLSAVPGVTLAFGAPTFNEFVLRLDRPADAVASTLLDKGVVGGLPLGAYYPQLENCLLVCVTEVMPRDGIERLAVLMNEALA